MADDRIDETLKGAKTFTGNIFEEVKRLAKLPEMEYERERTPVAKRLGIRKGVLDRAVENARPKKIQPEAKAPDADDLAQVAADIIACQDVLKLFVAEASKVIAGEEENAKLLFLVATTRLFKRTMHAAIKGPSSSGKSEIRSRVLDFFPPESVITFTSLSERALIYFEDSFSHKILSMGEAAGTDEQSFQDYLLRELMSSGRLSYPTVQKVGNEMVTVVIEKEGPVAFTVTTTRRKMHPENETRMLSLEMDDSEKQTKAVTKKVAEVEGLNITSDAVDYSRWHAFQRWLEIGERRVVVPYAVVLSENVPPKAVRLRRDFGQVIRAIKAHALLHRNSRLRDDDGWIVADIDRDYATVRDLMADLLAETSETKTKETIKQTVNAVKEATKTLQSDDGATAQSVAKILHLDKSSASRRLRSAEDAGLIANLETRRGRPGRYRATGESVETVEMLPSPDALKELSVQPPPNPLQPCNRTGNGVADQGDNGCSTDLQPLCTGAEVVNGCSVVANPPCNHEPTEIATENDSGCTVAPFQGGYAGEDLSGDREEREAIQMIDGELEGGRQ